MNSNWLGLTNLFHDSTNCKKELRRMILIQGRINSPPSDADGWARAVWKKKRSHLRKKLRTDRQADEGTDRPKRQILDWK